MKKDVLKNFANFTKKHLCWSLFSDKVAGLKVTSLNQTLNQLFILRTLCTRPQVFYKNKLLLKVSQNSYENTYVGVAFYNKVASLKLRLWQRCFLVNFASFLRTTFLQNTSVWLVLNNLFLDIHSTKLENIFSNYEIEKRNLHPY